MTRATAKPRKRRPSRSRPGAGEALLEALYEVQAEVQVRGGAHAGHDDVSER